MTTRNAIKVKAVTPHNYARLDCQRSVVSNTLIVEHTNADDGYYFYEFEVTGTKEELDIIEEFCNQVSELCMDIDG